jgi:hypothetical protein
MSTPNADWTLVVVRLMETKSMDVPVLVDSLDQMLNLLVMVYSLLTSATKKSIIAPRKRKKSITVIMNLTTATVKANMNLTTPTVIRVNMNPTTATAVATVKAIMNPTTPTVIKSDHE